MDLSNNNQAILDISLIQIGLIVFSITLVFAGYTLVYENPYYFSSEIRSVANMIETLLYEVDSYWIEQEKTFLFPTSSIPLKVTCSEDFFQIQSQQYSSLKKIIPVTQKLWIADRNVTWKNAESCHQQILNRTGHLGTREDPCENETVIQDWISSQWNRFQQQFHKNSFIWSTDESIIFEKCIIFKEITIGNKQKSIPCVEFIILRPN